MFFISAMVTPLNSFLPVSLAPINSIVIFGKVLIKVKSKSSKDNSAVNDLFTSSITISFISSLKMMGISINNAIITSKVIPNHLRNFLRSFIKFCSNYAIIKVQNVHEYI